MTRHPSGMVDRTNTKPTEANDSNGDQRTLHPQKVFSTLFYTLVNKDYLSTAASHQGPPKDLQRYALRSTTKILHLRAKPMPELIYFYQK